MHACVTFATFSCLESSGEDGGRVGVLAARRKKLQWKHAFMILRYLGFLWRLVVGLGL